MMYDPGVAANAPLSGGMRVPDGSEIDRIVGHGDCAGRNAER